MLKQCITQLKKITWSQSLKSRIILVMVLNTIIILILVGVFSYRNSVKTNDLVMQKNIKSHFDNLQNNLKWAYFDIDAVAKAISEESKKIFSEQAGSYTMKEYPNYVASERDWSSDEVMLFINSFSELSKKTNTLASTNSIFGAYALFTLDELSEYKVIWSNKRNINNEKINKIFNIPIVSEKEFGQLNSIHSSISGDFPVISVVYLLDEKNSIYLYLETSQIWLDTLFDKVDFVEQNAIIMTDKLQKVIYSSDLESTIVGQVLPENIQEQAGLRIISSNQKNQDWNIYFTAPSKIYDQQLGVWVRDYIYLIIGSVIVLLMLNFSIWKYIFKPFGILCKEMKALSENTEISSHKKVNIEEVDMILNEFYLYKVRSAELFNKVKEKEKMQQRLEYEKLLLQINPHFIRNSLNTIQWIARLEGQGTIEKMTTALIKVFNYNLEKDELIVSLSKEIETIKAYLDLQIIRYGEALTVHIQVEEITDEMIIPRFLLQPIVENAILYGLDDNNRINVKIGIKQSEENYYVLYVENGGMAMPQGIKKAIMSADESDMSKGVGIGLRYVLGAISHYFGEEFPLSIESEDGQGTTVLITLPKKKR